MVINKIIKKNNCWLKNSLQFNGRHDHDVITLRPSKHLWFLTTFFLIATKIHIKITSVYILFPLNPHLIIITKDMHAHPHLIIQIGSRHRDNHKILNV